MKGRTRALLAVATVMAVTGGQCAPAAGGDTAMLRVSAVVPRHASIRMAQPLSVTVSEADIARGYVDIATPVEVTVQSNLQQGYALVFERQGEHVRQVHVHGLQGEVLVGDAAASSARAAPGRGVWREMLQLRFRFELAAGTRAGQHAWPLHISMMPL
jgi:hypothetical protein